MINITIFFFGANFALSLIQHGLKIEKIVFDDIEFKFNKEKICIRANMNDIIQKMNSKFIRVHRSYIINTDYLKEIGGTILMANNITLHYEKNNGPQYSAGISVYAIFG